jgi:hypothetical protein
MPITITQTGPPPGATPAAIQTITGKGDGSIYSCWESHIKHNHETFTYFNTSGTRVMTTMTLPSSTLLTAFHNTSVPTTTLCDGHPRVLGETTTPVHLTFTDNTMLTSSQVYPGPTPTCTIPDPQCNNAYSALETASFSYLSSAYFSFFLNSGRGKTAIPNYWFGHLRPPCTSIKECPKPTASATCSLDAQRATVFYWPATTTPSNLCDQSPVVTSKAAVAEPTLTTAVWGNNFTVTSPSALVILRSVVASQHAKVTISPVPEVIAMDRCGSRTDATLQIAPEDLSSFRRAFTPTYIDEGHFTGYRTSSVPYRFDFGDLRPEALPYAAYAAQFACNTKAKEDHNCPSTMYFPSYSPSLSLPVAAKEAGIDGEFKSCVPRRINVAKYYPITNTKLEMPSQTIYGAQVSVAPKFSSIKPAPQAQVRFALAGATITSRVVHAPEE